MKKLGRRHVFPVSRRAFMRGSAAAVGISFAGAAGRSWGAEEKRLNVYNWDTYIGETTLGTFNARTGIVIQYDLYADNEELFAKLKEGNPGYDVIVPSDYMVEDMLKLNMLMPLDHSKIPNIKHLDPAFTNPAYDPIPSRICGVRSVWGIANRKSMGRWSAGPTCSSPSGPRSIRAGSPIWATCARSWAAP